MKCKVIKRYVDKYTHEIVYDDEIIDISKDRADELIAAGVCVEYRPYSDGGRKRTDGDEATAAGERSVSEAITHTGLTEVKQN